MIKRSFRNLNNNWFKSLINDEKDYSNLAMAHVAKQIANPW